MKQKINRTRIPLFTVIFILALSLLLSACQSGMSTPNETGEDGTGPIRIGVSLPLSGTRGVSGTAAGEGYQVWAAMVNDAGGLLDRQVELIILDNESEQDLAVSQYESLITEQEVDLVLGTQSSFLVIPTSAVVSEYGYAYVEPAGGAPEVFDRGLTNIFFAQSARSARQADPFALYILSLPEDVRPKTFAIVNKDDDFTLGVTDRLKTLLTEGGLELAYEGIYPEEATASDWEAIAAEVAAIDPDLIVGGTQAEDSVGQIQAYQAAGYQPRYAYFTTGPSLPDLFRGTLGSATEGVFSSVAWFSESTDYQNAEFVATYIDMFGGELSNIPEDAANAFTAGQVLQQAVENIQSIDNTALIEELHRGTFETNVGPLSFDATGAPEGSFLLIQWQGDYFVVVGPIDRAEADPLLPPKPEW